MSISKALKFKLKDLEERISNPEEILTSFDIPFFRNDKNEVSIVCPHCLNEVIELKRAGNRIRWFSNCNIHEFYRNDLISLIRVFNIQNDRDFNFGRILGKYEDVILGDLLTGISLSKDTGNYSLGFGKFKNCSLNELLQSKHFSYLRWLVECQLLPNLINEELKEIFNCNGVLINIYMNKGI